MKKTLKIVSVLLLLWTIISFASIVNAATAQMALNSTSKLKAGDTVEVTLRIANIQAGEGIDAIVATLDYDKNVFEQVLQENFTGMNQWSVNLYSTDTGIFTMTRSSKVNTTSDVLKIKLRAKSAVSANSTEIKLKDITASGGAVEDGGTGDIEVTEVKVNIAKETVQPIQPNTNQTDNKATGKIPQTGESIAIIVGISIVVIIAIAAFIKYKNTKIK